MVIENNRGGVIFLIQSRFVVDLEDSMISNFNTWVMREAKDFLYVELPDKTPPASVLV